VNDALLLTRVRDRRGALERVFGLIRRRALRARRVSVTTASDGVLELVLRVDADERARVRLARELNGLHDVIDITELGATATVLTRELALAHVAVVPGHPASWPVLATAGDTELLEITGTPEQIDDTLTRLQLSGVLRSFVRSGEVAEPYSLRARRAPSNLTPTTERRT
jgi:acetolactate synthase small subunit